MTLQKFSDEYVLYIMELIKKLLSLFSTREKYYLLLLIFLMIFSASLEVIGVGIIVPFIGIIADPTLVAKKQYLSQINQWLGHPEHHQLIIICGVLLICFFIFKNVFLACLIYLQNRITFKKYLGISRRLLSTYLGQPYSYHLEHNSAVLIRNLDQVGLVFQNGVLLPMLSVITEVVIVILMTLALIAIEPFTAITSVGTLGLLTMIFYYSVKSKMKLKGIQQQHFTEAKYKWIVQSLGGIKETKILGRENFFLDEYTKNLIGYSNTTRYALTMNQLPKLFIETIAVSGIVLITCILIWNKRDMTAILPVLALFAVAAVRIMPSFTRIMTNLSCIRFYRSSIDVVYHDLTRVQSIEIPSVKLDADPIVFSKTIELKDIFFKYDSSTQWILGGVSAYINKGESVAFIGPSGAGKTTLVDMVLGLLPPQKGTITIDGSDIWSNITSWQKSIGYVPQLIFLSDDTIRRNVAFGIPDAEIDDNRVWNALRMAQLEDFVQASSEKLEAFVGERGVRISGGQRQRLGIARALYHNPEVLIFDEATSSLDHETEQEVTNAINNLTGEKTIILITHRLTTAKKCKRLYKLSGGKIITSGNYQEVVGGV